MTLRIGPFMELGTVRGEPMAVAGRQLVPVARVLKLSLGRRGAPGAGGIVWTRPIAVEVIETAGPRRVAIPSPNRTFMIGLGAGLGLLWMLGLRRSRRPSIG
ncbi:MAG: hypothetical protein M1380_01945 [Chloroflexi bacterium]|nr:hypothetical protein [Chloroflexota bacterium]